MLSLRSLAFILYSAIRRARPVLRCSPVLSRQNRGTDYRHKYTRERARNEQQIPAIHVQPHKQFTPPQGDHGSGRKGHGAFPLARITRYSLK
jgi:hypothetical protein